jgi:hypothetical protein
LGFDVETKETPLSKVVIPMPKVACVIGEQETGGTFEARIAMATNQLVGNYNATEHSACSKLWHGRLNHIFELAGVNYQSHVEPIARASKKWRGSAAELPSQTMRAKKRKRKKISSRSGDWTFERENTLAKPMKQSQKFSIAKGGTQSLGFGVMEKTLSVKVVPFPIAGGKTSGQKTSSASVAGGDADCALARMIDLYSSSASEEEASPLGLCRNHA